MNPRLHLLDGWKHFDHCMFKITKCCGQYNKQIVRQGPHTILDTSTKTTGTNSQRVNWSDYTSPTTKE